MRELSDKDAPGPEKNRSVSKPDAATRDKSHRSGGNGRLAKRIAPRASNAVPKIAIQLDRTLTAGWIRNRHDVVMSGLIIARGPIESAALVVDGEVRAVCLYGQATETRQAFRLTFAQRRGPGVTQIEFEITARTREGDAHRAAFIVAADSDASPGVHVSKGAVCDLSQHGNAPVPVLLYVETAIFDRNRVLCVGGWCTGLSPIFAVDVFKDEQKVGSARIGQPRDDIAAGYPAYPHADRAGFTLSVVLPDDGAPDSIVVEAISSDGTKCSVVVPVEFAEAGPLNPVSDEVFGAMANVQSERDPRRAINVHSETATFCTDGELLVCGWAVCAAGVGSISIMLDGACVGVAELALPRPDVAEAYPGIPQARFSGFRMQRRLAPPGPGEHLLEVQVRNGLDDLQELRLALTTSDPPPAEPLCLPAAADPQEFRLQLDHPLVINGAVVAPVVGRLVVEGWALARSGVHAVEAFLGEQSLGRAYYGIPRRDVEAAFPGWDDALRSGYIFHCPARALASGTHIVRLQVVAKNGAICESQFQINVKRSEESEDYATIRRHISRVERELFQDVLDRLQHRPRFRLLLVTKGPIVPEKIEATLGALRSQAYRDWELLIVTDTHEPTGLSQTVDRMRLSDHVVIQAAADAASAFVPPSTGGRPRLIGVLFPGDELGCDALAEVAIADGLYPGTQFFYADEERISPASQAREPFFKPDWSPDLLLATNYIGRPWFAASDLLAQAAVTPQSLLAQQGDYDAVLRCTELASRIHHLPKLLCRRDSADAADAEGERRVLLAATTRRNIVAELVPGCMPGTWRLKRTAPVEGKVSIIIPTCAANGYVATCLKMLRKNTAYRDFEIVCIDNIPPHLPEWKALVDNGADKVITIPDAFNWSYFNNRAAEVAEGEYLLFLNDDIEVQQDDWLDALLEHAKRPDVGVVGPQLLYPNRRVQHAGLFLTSLGHGRHAFRLLAEDDPGYFGLALTQRNVIAVTGACMLTRRDTFNRLGRFEEAHSVINNDVDYCLRVQRAGLTVVYTPYAQLIHHELASRASIDDVYDFDHFSKQWRTVYASGDPFFSPWLNKLADDYRPDTEPARLICAGRPLFSKDEIQRILVVKLDHIGDLITALPALYRLRMHFPAARIYLLASGAAEALLAGTRCVDEVIEFDFFHARSGLGQKVIGAGELLKLRDRLTPYQFDLAIDLRKQVETRHVLEYVPAHFRAGYDYLGRFPWLDVALQWEGDNQRQRKYSHVSDDLVRLVDAVAAAAEADRRVLPPVSTEDPAGPNRLPPAARALFDRPVVAVHPSVGAIMRQWPPESFANVIDLLIEKNRVNVVLIGGRDEAALAKEVLEHVVNRKSVVSLVGKTSLAGLTTLLRACSLYLGNNSGPQHVAAALGLPTIGVYSGVVDATEWGPIGPRAVALQRDMVCSPCYLTKPEDCVRDMACLKGLEPAVVHQYCEVMLARAVPTAALAGPTQARLTRVSAITGGAKPAKSPGATAKIPPGNRPTREPRGLKQGRLQRE